MLDISFMSQSSSSENGLLYRGPQFYISGSSEKLLLDSTINHILGWWPSVENIAAQDLFLILLKWPYIQIPPGQIVQVV